LSEYAMVVLLALDSSVGLKSLLGVCLELSAVERALLERSYLNAESI
jgi:hypothetical protein